MPQFRNPDSVAPPGGNYHHAASHGPGRRLLISGQVGVAPDGRMAEGLEAQMRQSLANIVAILEAEGFAVTDVVKMTAFCVPENGVSAFRAIRGEIFGDHKPASTWLQVAGLASPDWLFEVEAEAVRED
jgi:enamine deaminase RidA (YjgF/YER057c/UK114 family)